MTAKKHLLAGEDQRDPGACLDRQEPVKAEPFPGLRPCAYCGQSDSIDVLHSMSFATYRITCLQDGWMTVPEKDLKTAITAWNAHQAQVRERRNRPEEGR